MGFNDDKHKLSYIRALAAGSAALCTVVPCALVLLFFRYILSFGVHLSVLPPLILLSGAAIFALVPLAYKISLSARGTVLGRYHGTVIVCVPLIAAGNALLWGAGRVGGMFGLALCFVGFILTSVALIMFCYCVKGVKTELAFEKPVPPYFIAFTPLLISLILRIFMGGGGIEINISYSVGIIVLVCGLLFYTSTYSSIPLLLPTEETGVHKPFNLLYRGVDYKRFFAAAVLCGAYIAYFAVVLFICASLDLSYNGILLVTVLIAIGFGGGLLIKNKSTNLVIYSSLTLLPAAVLYTVLPFISLKGWLPLTAFSCVTALTGLGAGLCFKYVSGKACCADNLRQKPFYASLAFCLSFIMALSLLCALYAALYYNSALRFLPLGCSALIFAFGILAPVLNYAK